MSYDKSFQTLVLGMACKGDSFFDRADVANEICDNCLDAPDWVPTGATQAPVSKYADHFAPAISREAAQA